MSLSKEQITMQAADIGHKVARKVFAARGNHSEIHLSEAELAALLGATYEIGFDSGRDSIRSTP